MGLLKYPKTLAPRSGDAADAVQVGDGEREDQRDGVAGHESRVRGVLSAGVPKSDQGAQKSEGEHGHRDADHSEHRTELVPEEVPYDVFQHEHQKPLKTRKPEAKALTTEDTERHVGKPKP